jgi:predicted nucleotidyltransferase
MDNFYLSVIRAFNTNEVEYMVVGGFAVNFHGYNRTTGDLDLWISTHESNLSNLKVAIDQLGFDLSEDAELALKAGNMISFSEGQYEVELMTRLNISKEITFEEALQKVETRIIEEIEVKVISLEDLKNEKAKSKRYKDLDDLSKLEEAEAYYAKKLKEE